MNTANFWRIWLRARLLPASICVLCCLPSAVHAQRDPQLQFVKIVASVPGTYSAPRRFGPGETLGLRITGLPAQEGVELQVQGLVNHDPGGAYDKNETVRLASLSSANLRKQNIATDASELVVALSSINVHAVMEVTARLVDKSGSRIGEPAKLTLDSAASVQAGPSLLKKAVKTGSTLLDRLMNVYQNVRQGTDPRSIFAVALKQGEAVSAPVQLPLERAQLHALAVSPAGNRLAWVTEGPGRYDLWASDLEKIAPVRIASSEEEILTPLFADESILVYVAKSTLFLADTDKPGAAQPVRTPLRSVARIDHAERKGSSIECIVSGERSDTPGLALPHLARISVAGREAEVFRLPMNPFYPSYSLLVEGAPFFFAGTAGGVEGIHSFKPEDPDGPVTTLYKVRSPGLVALAANGSRLVFAGAP